MKSNKIEPIFTNTSKTEFLLRKLFHDKKKIFTIFSSFILISFIASLCYYISNKTKTKTYWEFKQSSLLANNTTSHLKKLKRIAAIHPTCQPGLDGALVQGYLNLGSLQEAKTIYRRIQKRQRALFSVVDQFNEVTFLIEEKKYQEAFEKGIDLKETLKVKQEFKTLYAIHLLRLISLEQRMEQDKGSLLSEFLSLNAREGSEFKEAFKLGKLEIVDYLNQQDLSN